MMNIESTEKLLAYLPVSHEVKIREILESMQRWERRNENHHNEKRDAERGAYETWVAIVVPVDPKHMLFLTPTNVCAFFQGRNITTSGMSMIGSDNFEPAVMTDDTPLLELGQLVSLGGPCSIGLPDNNGLQMTWISAEVVRLRCAQEDCTEVGVRFLEKVPADDPIYEDAEQLFLHYRENSV